MTSIFELADQFLDSLSVLDKEGVRDQVKDPSALEDVFLHVSDEVASKEDQDHDLYCEEHEEHSLYNLLKLRDVVGVSGLDHSHESIDHCAIVEFLNGEVDLHGCHI